MNNLLFAAERPIPPAGIPTISALATLLAK